MRQKCRLHPLAEGSSTRYRSSQPDRQPVCPVSICEDFTMAALIALGLCFGLFALFNLLEFKRLD